MQRLSNLLGHPIDLQSRPGHGSMFSIGVPLAVEEPPDAQLPGKRSAVERATAGFTVLVIEDDPTIRELLELLLSDAGHHPISVADGVAALAMTERPDLIIADFNLPNGPNGVEVITTIRQRFTQRFPAIVLTGDISTATLSAIAKHRCMHLDKPVEAAELLRAVVHLLAAPAQMLEPDDKAAATSDMRLSTPIFVVDDDAAIRDAVREMLEANGWSVETYASCEAFLGALRQAARMPGN